MEELYEADIHEEILVPSVIEHLESVSGFPFMA
jgi:hypothetical protein